MSEQRKASFDVNSQGHPEPPRTVVSSSQPFVFVSLDCIYYAAGEKVTGEILLNLPHEFPQSQLLLSSKGIEEIHIFDPSGRGQIKNEATSEVYSLETQVHQWNSTPAGEYVFPFSFKLPEFAPSTFYFSGPANSSNYIKSSINYSISAKLVCSEKQLSHTRMLVVRNRYTRTKPGTVLETNEVVNGCCCSEKGSSRLKLSVKGDSHPQIEGVIRYKVDPDNLNCSAPINHVISIIGMEIQFTLPSTILTVRQEISNISRATWISAHTNMIYEKDFEYISDLRMNTDDINPGSNQTPLIQCVYYYEIQIYYDIVCNKSPIILRMPFHVDPKDTFVRENPVLPRPWEPEESLIENFVVVTSRSSMTEMIEDIEMDLDSKLEEPHESRG